MRVHVRGRLGVQLLQAFVGIGQINEDETPEIVVNHGGNMSTAAKSQFELVTVPNCIISHQEEFRKTPYWVDGAPSIAFAERERTIKFLPLKNVNVDSDVVIHLRMTDKSSVSYDSCKKLVYLAQQENPNSKVSIISDSMEFAQRIAEDCKVETIEGDVTRHWFVALNAKHLYHTPSAYSFSTLLYRTDKKQSVVGSSWCDSLYPGFDSDMLFLNEAKRYCPNLRVL